MPVTQGAHEFHFSPRPNRAGEIAWRPWSPDAFEAARTGGRPILLSISAVWCHWCHVMDETTYSDPAVIEAVNRDYVAIRVDNDVRPDINQRYNMGGWPSTVFLTSSGDILTGATYLPPEQMASALTRIATYYRLNQAEIAARVLEGRKRVAGAAARSAGELDLAGVDAILAAATSAYDPEFGGFGPAPKFPQTDALLLLLEQAQLRGDGNLRDMAVNTLRQMAGGGMYDHVEGGFFRYSTTQDWSVPHFEKMLEDHAGLVAALSFADLGETLDRTTGYLDTVLRDPASGLYAGSQDADEHYYSLDAAGRRALDPPYVDRRVYTAWNAALAIAYLDAGLRLRRPRLLQEAQQLLTALFDRAYRRGHGMARTEGTAGQLGDQVWALWAAVRGYEHGLGRRWLDLATELAAHLEEHYADGTRGGYFDRASGDDLGRLREPIKPLAENAVAAMALHELGVVNGDPADPYQHAARRALESVAALPPTYGLMAAAFGRALDRTRHEVKVSTANPELARAALLAHPYTVLDPSGDERAVVCVGTICLAPVSTPTALEAAIAEATTASA